MDVNRLKIARVVKMPIEAQATAALREAIVTGAVPTGERITEIQVSQQMNLSRATVRTALHQLAKEGLLTLIPYTGWKVVSLSARDVWELYTLRSAVERLAAQLVASTMTPAKAERLDAAFDVLVQECRLGGAGPIAEADFALHKAIVLMADHERLAVQYGLIEQQTRMYIRSSDTLDPTPRVKIDQHRPIVDAIRAGKPEEAGRLSEEHNLIEGEKLSTHLKRLEAGQPAEVGARPGRTVRKRAAVG